MKKKLTMWVIGGLVTASAIGLGFSATVGNAAEKEAVKPAMHGMMKDGDMQKHCMEMMKSPEMQSMMKEMMKNPEMQAIMKEVMQENK